MKTYTFESVMGALGLNVRPGETPATIARKDFVTLRRFVWRNYRLSMGKSRTNSQWFTLTRIKKDVSTGAGVRARSIYSKDKAISGMLWQAADFARRNRVGIYRA